MSRQEGQLEAASRCDQRAAEKRAKEEAKINADVLKVLAAAAVLPQVWRLIR